MRAGWLPSVAIGAVYVFSLGSANPTCESLTYWLSTPEFSQLASQLSQPVIKPVPPASACYPPSHPSTDVSTHLTDGHYRSNVPVATRMEAVNFESFTFENKTINACYYYMTLGFPCQQGNVPILEVDAGRVGDIQAGAKFAANTRLVIQNTGHDYLGRSMACDAFMISAHNVKSISYDDHFVPSDGPSAQICQAVILGARVKWDEALAAALNSYNGTIGSAISGLTFQASILDAGMQWYEAYADANSYNPPLTAVLG